MVAGWWGHQPGRPAVVGVLTDHSFKKEATICNASILIRLLITVNTVFKKLKQSYHFHFHFVTFKKLINGK